MASNAELLSQVLEIFNGEKTKVEGIEIFNLYDNSHKINFTEQDLEDMVELGNKNTNSGIVLSNLKVSHSDEQLILKELLGEAPSSYEELPIMGLLSNLRREGKSILADVYDVPVKMKEILFGGRFFKSISPEIIMNWRDTGKKFIKAISLTNKPSLMHIQDVHMSETLQYGGNLILEEISMTDEEKAALDAKKKADDLKATESLVQKFTESVSGVIGDLFKKNKTETQTVDDDKKKKTDGDGEKVVSLSEVMEMKSDFEKQISTLNKKLFDKDEEQKKMFSDVEELKKSTKVKNTEAICEKALLSGVPKTVIDFWKPVLLSEASDAVVKLSKVVDDETIEVERPMAEMVEKFFEICPGKVDYQDKTKTDTAYFADEGSKKKFNSRIAELKAEGKSQHEALTIVGEEMA